MESQMTDKEIILLAKKDRKHFEVLYDKYFELVFRFILKRVASSDLAGDLTQQTFLNAMLALNRYEDRGFAFSSWLCRIALNEINGFYRKTKKQRFVELDPQNLGEFLISLHPSDEPVKRSDEENANLLSSLMEQLSEKEVNLLQLKFFDKLGHGEIASIVGSSESAVKVRCHRVIKKLRKQLEKKRYVQE